MIYWLRALRLTEVRSFREQTDSWSYDGRPVLPPETGPDLSPRGLPFGQLLQISTVPASITC